VKWFIWLLPLLPPSAFAGKAVPSLELIRISDTVAVTQHLGRGKLVVNGKEWVAKRYCNTSTIKNPAQLELYSLNERAELVVFCPGARAGEENVISIFPQGKWPKSRRLKPAKGARVSDEVLRNSVIRLLK